MELNQNSKNFINFSCYIFVNFISTPKTNIIDYHIQEKLKIFLFFYFINFSCYTFKINKFINKKNHKKYVSFYV